MMDMGLRVTINSDDPAYFGGYMNENFTSVGAALGLSAEELTAIARNGFAASFMRAHERQSALRTFDEQVLRDHA
jgi:adenosine deaminase